MKAAQIEQLVDEFRALGFDEMNSRRSAFTAVTHVQGWNTARTSRYLGVSRARVGQRIDKLRVYAEDPDMPLLHRIMRRPSEPEPPWLADTPVAFLAASWRNEEFSAGLLDLLASDSRLA